MLSNRNHGKVQTDKPLMKSKNNKDKKMKMKKKIFLSLIILFCCKAYVNAMESERQKTIKAKKLILALVDHKKYEDIEQLIKNGADPSRIITVQIKEISKNKHYLLSDRTTETTPLNFALHYIDIEQSIVILLIKNAKKVDVTYSFIARYVNKDYKLPVTNVSIRKAPIHVLIGGQRSVNDKIFLINLMQKHGFNKCSMKTYYIDPKGNDCINESALHTLCNIDYPDENNYKIAKTLIENGGVNPNYVNSNRDTPFHILARKFLWLISTEKHPKKFVMKNPDSTKDAHEVFSSKIYYPEKYCVIFKNIVKELQNGGADLNLKNNKNETPTEIIKVLSKSPFNIFDIE